MNGRQIVGALVGLGLVLAFIVVVSLVAVLDGQNFRAKCVEAGGYVVSATPTVCAR